MNIEIKFRAWDEKEHKMFNPSSICFKNGIMWVCDVHGENKLEYELINPNAMLMQYTGLKDKNGKGKEVYKNDFFETSKGIGIIEWLEDRWIVKFNTYQISLAWFLKNDITREVIGNIYENPIIL